MICWGKTQTIPYKDSITTYAGAIEDIYFKYITKAKVCELEGFLEDLKNIYEMAPTLPNFLLTQNHTPSRLLAIWQETKAFFEDFWRVMPEKLDFILRQRAHLILKNPEVIASLRVTGVHELFLENGKRLEALWLGSRLVTVNAPYDDELVRDCLNQRIVEVQGEYLQAKATWVPSEDCRIIRVDRSDLAYRPCRRLLLSPLVFFAMVPGSKALEAAGLIKKKYDERFGKVKGRLPFSLGLVFFQEHTPMFAVLDAGKRLVRNFERSHVGEPSSFVVQMMDHGAGETLSFKGSQSSQDEILVPASFNEETSHDPHYPYTMVTSSASLENRPSFYQTNLLGCLLHFREIQANDTILARPNYLDLIFLDTTTRRFDLTLEEPSEGQHRRRRPAMADYLPATFPYYLDELDEITRLWGLLKNSRISDTGLRGVETLLRHKLSAWKDKNKPHPWETEEWQNLVRSTIDRNFAGHSKDVKARLEVALTQGLFFDTLDLYWRILKERLHS